MISSLKYNDSYETKYLFKKLILGNYKFDKKKYLKKFLKSDLELLKERLSNYKDLDQAKKLKKRIKDLEVI
jgi:hypothetical protein